jgi:hypothetical protein
MALGTMLLGALILETFVYVGCFATFWSRFEPRFGIAFSRHRFRASLATLSATHSADTPLDAQAIVGNAD